MSRQIGEIVIRIPVIIEHESGDWENGVDAFFYAQAGKPELVSHTLDTDGQQLVAQERAMGDFWAEHLPDEAIRFQMRQLTPAEADALHKRTTERYRNAPAPERAGANL